MNETTVETWTEDTPVFFNETVEDEFWPRSLENFNETVFINETDLNGTIFESGNATIDGRRFTPDAIPKVKI